MDRKKLTVVRGLFPRLAQAEFFSKFKEFEVKFIGSGLDKTWQKAAFTKRIKLINLELEPVYYIDPIKLVLGKTTHRSWVRLKDLERKLQDVDVINTYEVFHFFSAQATSLAHQYQKLMTTTVWTSFSHPSRFVPPYSLNVRETVALTDLFIARSEKAADYLSSLEVPARKIKVIYPGVDLKRFYPLKRKTWEEMRILFVGQLERCKGLDDLLVIFPKLYREFSNLELWICGQGKLEKKVKKAAQSLPIKYLGQVSYFKIPEIYRSVDLFTAPSKDLYFLRIKIWEEFFSYALMEALASGLPIIATRCGGIEEEIGKENLLIEQGDRGALLKALQELLLDREKRQELGIKNRKRAKKLFDLDKQAKKTEEAILAAL